MKLPLLIAAALAAALCLFAEPCQAGSFKAASIFGSKMVLQRGGGIPVWGWADAGSEVSLEFAGQRVSAKAGDDGKWALRLAPLEASFEGRQMKIAQGDSQIVFNDVLVGDVWLCSGQSNMQFNLGSAEGGKEAAAQSKDLAIRFVNIANELSKEPIADLKAAPGSWKAATPESAGAVSAVAFYFAREMQRKLNVPQGLIVSAWPGSQVITWIPKESLPGSLYDRAKDADEEEYAKLWANPSRQDAEAAVLDRMANSNQEILKIWAKQKLHWRALHLFPGWTFNAKIRPLAPFAIKGVLWYQGEDNHAMGMKYSDYMQCLASAWRKEWSSPELPFFIALLAPFKYEREGQLPSFWMAQLDAARRIGHSGIASSIDIGNAEDIHPKKKEPLGVRLSMAALKECFGEANSAPGPAFKSSATANGSMEIRFDNVAGGLKADGQITGFEIAGADKQFVPAEAAIKGNDAVSLRASSVAAPAFARYAWSNTPSANLFNGEGLPALPFSTEWTAANGK